MICASSFTNGPPSAAAATTSAFHTLGLEAPLWELARLLPDAFTDVARRKRLRFDEREEVALRPGARQPTPQWPAEGPTFLSAMRSAAAEAALALRSRMWTPCLPCALHILPARLVFSVVTRLEALLLLNDLRASSGAALDCC